METDHEETGESPQATRLPTSVKLRETKQGKADEPQGPLTISPGDTRRAMDATAAQTLPVRDWPGPTPSADDMGAVGAIRDWMSTREPEGTELDGVWKWTMTANDIKAIPAVVAMVPKTDSLYIVTDGSHDDRTDVAGFAALLVRRDSIIILAGARLGSTSGLNEQIGVAVGLDAWKAERPQEEEAIVITDYANVVEQDFDIGAVDGFRTKVNPKIWIRMKASIDNITQSKNDNILKWYHQNSHVKDQSQWNWAVFWNEVADRIAKWTTKWHSLHPERAQCTEYQKELEPLSLDEIDELWEKQITLAETEWTIRQVRNTAPSALGVPPIRLKDLSGRLKRALALLLNRIWTEGKLPERSATALNANIPKSGPSNEWRSLTVQGLVLTCINRILTQRLLTRLAHMQTIARGQKCNIRGISGMREHNIVLDAILDDIEQLTHQGITAHLTLLITDIRKAFPSVEPELLELAIEAIVQPKTAKFAKLIRTIYREAKIVISDEQWATIIDKGLGINEGDPLSPILFIIFMQFARGYAPTNLAKGYRLSQQAKREEVAFLFADDNNRITCSLENAKTDMVHLTTLLKAAMLDLKPQKCMILSLSNASGKVEAVHPKLLLDCPDGGPPMRVKTLRLDDQFKMLGIKRSFDAEKRPTVWLAIREYMSRLDSLDKSALSIQRKLIVLKETVAPAL
jgi:hypothetical protein